MLQKLRGGQRLHVSRRRHWDLFSPGASEVVRNAGGGCQRHDKKPGDGFGPEESCQGAGRIGRPAEFENFTENLGEKDLRYSGTDQHNLHGKPLKGAVPSPESFRGW